MMNLISRRDPPVDLDRLAAEINEAKAELPPQVKQYAPPAERYTPTQLIAHAVTRLTWKEAEAMGEAIKTKIVEEDHKTFNLTRAIQAWAKDWENFDAGN